MRVPFPKDPSAGSLVIELPQRFVPGRYRVIWRVITNGVIYVFVEVPDGELPALVDNLKKTSVAMQRELARKG